jgi:hypothetical protein
MSNITLTPGTPQTTTDATAVVTLSAAPAAGSSLRFSLVVIDDLGNKSAAAFIDVAVQAMPVAVLKPVKTISAGAAITLDGTGSTPAANIKSYQWELVPPGTH